MKYLLVIVLLFGVCEISYAWDNDTYEIKPRYQDITPNDGFMDAGTTFNPLEMQSRGQPIATIQPKYMDITPNDGFMDAGSAFNPMEVKFKNR